MDVQRFDGLVDVSDVAAREGAKQAVTLVVPAGALDGPRVLMFGFPGACYSRGYYDMQWNSRSDYSEAEFHTARGWIVACVDHLGVGESTPAETTFPLDVLAAGNAHVVRTIVERLRAGTLAPGLPKIDVGRTLGVGHSMGGAITIITQANHTPFDGLAVLGFGAIQTVIPSPPGQEFDFEKSIRWSFFWDDDDPALVEADTSGGHPIRATAPPWGSVTVPEASVTLLEPGAVAEQAAAVRTPVFVGVGERDVVPDPWSEPTAYRGSRDISLAVVPKMAHMHNFASTRHDLWMRLHSWGDRLM